MTSDGALKITGFGLVQVGMPEEVMRNQCAPMQVTPESILRPTSGNVPFCLTSGNVPFCLVHLLKQVGEENRLLVLVQSIRQLAQEQLVDYPWCHE
jgi:hypothetical protein